MARDGVDLTAAIQGIATVLGNLIAQLPQEYHGATHMKVGLLVSAVIHKVVEEGKDGTAIMVAGRKH